MPAVQCQFRARRVVIIGSAVLAVLGWAGSAWSWIDHGYAAGVHPGYLMALSVAITGTLSFAVAVVLPDSQRIYALGWHERGRHDGTNVEHPLTAARRHLEAVR